MQRKKTRGIRAIDGFRKKLIPDSEIPKFPDFEVKSKIEKSLKSIIPLKNILLRFMKLILIFIKIMKKTQADKNGCKYILFRIDIYFSECFQQQKLMKKDILTEKLFLKKKDQKHQKKKLGCKFIKINTSNAKNCYDLDYEVGNAQAFIDE